MPFAICPVCGSSFHLSIRVPTSEWETEHVKERNDAGVPLLQCIRCWVELRAGHKVTLRVVPSELSGVLVVGEEGVVVSCGNGTCSVAFGAITVPLQRSDLLYVVGQPSPA